MYAVVWHEGDDVASGSLELSPEGLDLHGREMQLSISFSEVDAAFIAQARGERLHGLPVLVLRLHTGAFVRIASLEGAGVLHELAASVQTGADLAVTHQ